MDPVTETVPVTENVDLEKGAKGLASHLKKSAGHHEKMAGCHEKCMKAHEGHADHHESMMGKDMEMADGEKSHKAHHKASASFHKSMAKHHEALHKHHTDEAANMHKASESAMTSEEESKKPAAKPKEETKAAESTELKKETPVSETNKEVVKTDTPATDPAAGVPAIPDFNATIGKALDNKLTEAVGAAFERVLNSDDFSKKVDNAIAAKLLEKLGGATVPTEIRTFPVNRPGEQPRQEKASSIIDMTGIDPDLQDLCKVD